MSAKSLVLLMLFALIRVPDVVASAELVTPLPPGEALSLSLPANWTSAARTTDPVVTLELSSANKSTDFVVLMTAMPARAGTQERVRELVIAMGNQQLSSALQSSIELIEVEGAEAVAYLYHLTDRDPEKGPGDYREAHQGAMLLGSTLVTITILTHPGDTELVEQAKQVIASAKIVRQEE